MKLSKVLTFGFIILLSISTWSYPITQLSVGYVDDQQCATCHRAEFKLWKNSHHALAMQLANEKTVLGNFNNTHFDAHHLKAYFFKDKNNYFIKIKEPNKKSVIYQVRYTFGVMPLQQYLLDIGNGRLQAFTIAWDTRNKKWFDLYPQTSAKPNETPHWSSRVFTWNHFCADCHSTAIKKNYHVDTNSYATTWSAISVGCQACHGPGANHSNKNSKLLINYSNMSVPQKVEVCARCHSRRYVISPKDKMHEPLLNHYIPEILNEGIFYADGQIQEEDYEYASFLQSKMYRAGVFCTACHNPHSLQLKIKGNALCLQCHQSNPPSQFRAAASSINFDSPQHYFHTRGKSGSFCVDCHMPSRTYMQIDVRRNHNFSIPRPDLTIKYGIPNACNQCHADKTPEWSQEQIEKWYGKKTYTLSYADIFTRARRGNPQAEKDLIAIASLQHHSPIVRATAVDLLKNYSSDQAKNALILATKDSDPLVRVTAVMQLGNLALAEKITVLTPLLNDPIRAVRLMTARMLVTIPQEKLQAGQRQLLENALNEYKSAQLVQIDQPEGNLNLGTLAQAQGDARLAEKYYKSAIQLDKAFVPAELNLSQLYAQIGDPKKAQDVLKTAIEHNKQNGDLLYYYGLIMAEMGDWNECVIALTTASELQPTNLRVLTNLGIALQKIGQVNKAEKVLLKAFSLDDRNPKILQLLTVLYMQQQNWDKAYIFADKLYQIFPNDLQVKQVLDEIIQMKIRKAPGN